MAHIQPLAEEQQHRIEKRDQDERRATDRRQRDVGPVGEERRSGKDRRADQRPDNEPTE